MIVLLPKRMDGLADLERSLTVQDLKRRLLNIKTVDVLVSMPKFELLSQFELGRSLAEMGMPSAFAPDADFSAMDGRRYLLISNAIHKAFVAVNEEGTEAAAATAVVVKALEGGWTPTYRFNVDHPFIFMVCHEKSGAILFMGRVVDPSPGESPRKQ